MWAGNCTIQAIVSAISAPNNAGLAAGLEHIDQGSTADWDAMIDTNVKGLLYVMMSYPRAASRSAVACPMPEVAPVIKACFFIMVGLSNKSKKNLCYFA